MQFGLIIAVGELLAILASIFIAHFLTRPIKTLAAKIRSVADGDLDHRIEVGRRDEIGELIRSFNDMTKKLKEARRKSRLSAIGEAATWISHELKNSLMLLKSFVSVFPEEHEDERFVDRFGRLVPPEISRWERMLNEFSGLSSHNELKIARTDVQKLLFDTLDMMARELEEKGIGVEFARTGRAMVLAVDQERLRQVFVNLIVNAMAAMPEGGTLTVSADLVPAQDTSGPDALEVRIKDTGCGIPADQIEKIFDPFYSCRRGGAGLGLTISRRIVEQHGGSIQVKSRLGAGTMFIIKLPARAPQGVPN
jgi:signal transduction histidine kinase